MRPLAAVVTLVLALPLAAPSCAEERDHSPAYDDSQGAWGFDPEASAASLARDGWQFLAMSTLSWPDGRQAVVTMWQSDLGDHARCFDYFDADMRQTGGKCERTGTGI
jgi:hypothetical protein